jgi:hypothetical protein
MAESNVPTGNAMERDPTGRSPHEAGAKMDEGKVRLGLVLMDFADALWAVGDVGTYGATKYSAHGWKYVPNGQQRYTDALLRHLLSEADEDVDRESGLLHAACVAWNALARLQRMFDAQKSCGEADYLEELNRGYAKDRI